MNKTGCIILLMILCISCSKNHCRLEDGRYEVVYNQKYADYSNFEYEVNSDTIKEIRKDSYVFSVIGWISENEYHLDDLPSVLYSRDSLSGQSETKRKPFYRLSNCRKDTIDFKLISGDHTINDGKLIKIE